MITWDVGAIQLNIFNTILSSQLFQSIDFNLHSTLFDGATIGLGHISKQQEDI